MKICVLILSTQNSIFEPFKQAIRATWAKDLEIANVDYFFYEGNYPENIIEGDTIRINCNDGLENVYDKFYETIKILKSLGFNYDCFYRTNLSSYIDVSAFISYITHFNINSQSYVGVNGNCRIISELLYSFKITRGLSKYAWFGKEIKYKSGSGFFIGKDLTNVLLSTPKSKINFLDDVMIGYLLTESHFIESSILRMDIKEDNSHKVSKEIYQEYLIVNHLFHYRLKNLNRSFDIQMMYLLHNKFTRVNICTF